MKLAVWGLGKHAIKNILPSIEKSSVLELYGIYSRNTEVINECKRNFNCLSWSSPDEMLKDEKVETVYLSTPPGLHFEQGTEVLKVKKNLWCEKPFTTNLKHSKSLVELSIRNDIPIFEAFMYEYHPHFLKIKDIVDQGILGDIKKLYCRFGLPPLNHPGYREDLSLGASSLLDLGSYPLSAVMNLFPNREPLINYSEIIIDPTSKIDNQGLAELRMKGGPSCYLEWSYNRSYRNEIDIWGTEGSLYSDKFFSKDSTFSPLVVLRDLNGNKRKIEIDSANHFQLMLESFKEISSKKDKISLHREKILKLITLMEDLKNSSSNIEL